MIELKVKRYIDEGAEYGGPPISYLHMAWIPAEPQTTREEYFYLFNEYESGDDLDINPSCGLGNLNLRLVPINASAQALLDYGAIQIRHDVMSCPTGQWADSVRVGSDFDWYTPNGSFTVGDIPIYHSDDTDKMCRFDIRVTNIAVDDVVGQSYFLLAPDFAIPATDLYSDGTVYDQPIYDMAGYDGGGATADFSEIYLDSSLLIEVFLMDRGMQEMYEDFGIEFTEIL